ncbi:MULTISPECIES: penicillin-binding transpeptidase domain-containing protein [unclassified Gordonia (in: high G+C Gram-positive bacteria)]|uniref:penicillin-binding transpeptidase domain-containing protein n=1 Tax=unclassified Gordonia (in: high G+C Gram-positive bacteria) TaxID=2657482 RepID=UPI001965019C|nr:MULTISPECIES: penicillin-binding transpeptidase domain-containing protein [unclassified Gordonia (in: high G+C Gram-positive bacteria)]MBN0971153.1 penicillin-binding protein [Gordonia sp. BP-119]MBN0981773.1 penicillin-binding protein [Gordonia sp. BP-94]
MRRWWALVSACAVIVGTVSGCFLPSDSPEDALRSFAAALQEGDATRAAALTDDPAAAGAAITAMFDGMGRTPKLSVAADLVDGEEVSGTLDHRWQIRDRSVGYQTSVVLAEADSHWKIRWQPSVLHRQLRAGESFSYSDDRAYRTPVLDTNDRPLMTWQAVTLVTLQRAQLDSAEMLARALRPVEPGMTAAGIRAAFAGNSSSRSSPVETHTVIRLRESDLRRVQRSVESIPGVALSEQGALLSATRALHSPAMSGLEEIWREHIDATAGWSVQIVGADGTPTHLVDSAQPGVTPPVRTTLDRDVQTRAQLAVDGERRPAMVVAIEPSTGGIVAVAQNDAADRSGSVSLTGLYPPGSTFKTITTAAALDAGAVQPTSQVRCPGRTTIEGRTIPNEDDFDLGTVALPTAFARSCNTTMGALANRLPDDALTAMARRFGIGADYTVPGLTTVTGSVPKADSPALRVENGIGQGTVTVSPFGLALAEASLARGETVVPGLVRGRQTTGDITPQPISDDVARALRSMMRDTVTRGTATALRDIPGLGGKTGTAEYGNNENPHGWFAGIVGDLAFATLVVGGGSSAPAVEVTGEFLRPLSE